MRHIIPVSIIITAFILSIVRCEKEAHPAETPPYTTEGGFAEHSAFEIKAMLGTRPATLADSLEAAQAKLMREVWICERKLNEAKQAKSKPKIYTPTALEPLYPGRNPPE